MRNAGQVFFTAKFLGKMLDDSPDNTEALIDTRMIAVSAAFIQAGNCNIDRSMVVAATHKTPHLVFIGLNIHTI